MDNKDRLAWRLWRHGVQEMRSVYAAQLVVILGVYIASLTLRHAVPAVLAVIAFFDWMIVRELNYHAVSTMIEEMYEDLEDPRTTKKIVLVNNFIFAMSYVMTLAAMLRLIWEVT